MADHHKGVPAQGPAKSCSSRGARPAASASATKSAMGIKAVRCMASCGRGWDRTCRRSTASAAWAALLGAAPPPRAASSAAVAAPAGLGTASPWHARRSWLICRTREGCEHEARADCAAVGGRWCRACRGPQPCWGVRAGWAHRSQNRVRLSGSHARRYARPLYARESPSAALWWPSRACCSAMAAPPHRRARNAGSNWRWSAHVMS
jgi:hypothetical protein